MTLNSNAASTQAGDTVNVVYYEADGVTEISSGIATVQAAPLPGLGGRALVVLAGSFVFALTWRLVVRPSRARD